MYNCEMENHDAQFVADLHCDALFAERDARALAFGKTHGHFDFRRMEEGGVWLEVLSLFVDPKHTPREFWWKAALQQLAIARKAVELTEGRFAIATTANEVEANFAAGIRSIMIEIEGLHPIEHRHERLELLWKHGVRIFTLCWNNPNEFCNSAVIDQNIGLTDDGFALVRELHTRGACIDLSHASDAAFFQVTNMGIPPMLSHSCVRELKNSPRNATLDMLTILGHLQGICAVNFYPGFLSAQKKQGVSVEKIIDHVEAVIYAAGESAVALGSDFDGVECLPFDLPDIGAFASLRDKFAARGFDSATIAGIFGENFFNYLKNRRLG